MIQASTSLSVSEQSRTNFASRPLIVTPKSIPDFMIPDLNSTKTPVRWANLNDVYYKTARINSSEY